MGRSTPGTGPHLFKQQWGAIEQRLFYQYYYSGSASTAVNLSNARGKYGLAIATWKKLPLFITRFLGPYVVRHLPDL
jgi:serine/alanine adding enzyme